MFMVYAVGHMLFELAFDLKNEKKISLSEEPLYKEFQHVQGTSSKHG